MDVLTTNRSNSSSPQSAAMPAPSAPRSRLRELTKPTRRQNGPSRLRFPSAIGLDEDTGELFDVLDHRDLALALDRLERSGWH